jgi:membrane associated rhomboid family serine protease
MRWWTVTTWIIVINILVYVVDMILFRGGFAYIQTIDGVQRVMPPLWGLGHFSTKQAIHGLEVWRFVTFQFLHDYTGLGHIVFNMLALYFFGPLIENYLGSRRYLAFYLICGVAGPVAYLLIHYIGLLTMPPWVPMVGASAGVFGVLIGAAQIAPRARVQLLFPPIPMELRTLAWVLIGIAVFVIFSRGHNAGGEAAHLGGAAMGAWLIRNPRLLNFVVRRRQPPRTW